MFRGFWRFFLGDPAFLLTVGSFLLTDACSCVLELFCLQLESFYLQPETFYLQLELSCLRWESASDKHQRSSTVSSLKSFDLFAGSFQMPLKQVLWKGFWRYSPSALLISVGKCFYGSSSRGLLAPSQRPSERPSQSATFLSELLVLLPLIVLVLETLTFARSPENFCGFLLRICLKILHWKMAGIFGEIFLVSVSHERKQENSPKISEKIRSKIRGEIRDENSKNSGNFRSATFLT